MRSHYFRHSQIAKPCVINATLQCPTLAIGLQCITANKSISRIVQRISRFRLLSISFTPIRPQSRTIAATLREIPPSDEVGPEIGESVTLLALLAIPSFVALCFLAIAHTFQTMSLQLAEDAPFPSEPLLREYFPAPPAFQTAQSFAARVPTYERLLKNSTSRLDRSAFSRESNLAPFLRLPVSAAFLRECRRSWPDSGFRTMAIVYGM
jgi:hypothetical protein